jgi:hypothetical protein
MRVQSPSTDSDSSGRCAPPVSSCTLSHLTCERHHFLPFGLYMAHEGRREIDDRLLPQLSTLRMMSQPLGLHRDPGDARKLVDPVLSLMMEAVHHYEGTVNQVMGDGSSSRMSRQTSPSEDPICSPCSPPRRSAGAVLLLASGYEPQALQPTPRDELRVAVSEVILIVPAAYRASTVIIAPQHHR